MLCFQWSITGLVPAIMIPHVLKQGSYFLICAFKTGHGMHFILTYKISCFCNNNTINLTLLQYHCLYGSLDNALRPMCPSPLTENSCVTAPLSEKCDAFICHGLFSNLILRILKISLLFGLIFYAAAYCFWACLAHFPSCLLDACRWASVILTLCLVKSCSLFKKQKWEETAPVQCRAPSWLIDEYKIRKLVNKEVLPKKG